MVCEILEWMLSDIPGIYKVFRLCVFSCVFVDTFWVHSHIMCIHMDCLLYHMGFHVFFQTIWLGESSLSFQTYVGLGFVPVYVLMCTFRVLWRMPPTFHACVWFLSCMCPLCLQCMSSNVTSVEQAMMGYQTVHHTWSIIACFSLGAFFMIYIIVVAISKGFPTGESKKKTILKWLMIWKRNTRKYISKQYWRM